MGRKAGFFATMLGALAGLTSCSGLLYYPSGQLFYPPSRFQLAPEEITIPSANGAKIFAWYFQNRAAKKPKATVVFFHGNAENISSHYVNAIWLLDHGYDVLAFDYQGYGRSEGSPSPRKTVEDGEAALRWAAARSPGLPIVVFGQSLGGNVALRAAINLKDQLPIRFVAVDSTFASYRSVGRRVMARSWVTWPFQWLGWLLLSDAYAPDGEIASISPVPLLVIHGEKDRVVEISLGEAVYAQAKDPKEFWRLPVGGHTDVFATQDPAWKMRFVERLDKAVAVKQ